MDLCWQSNAVEVAHRFSSKEQVSFNFMVAVTICSDFGAQENKIHHLEGTVEVNLEKGMRKMKKLA